MTIVQILAMPIIAVALLLVGVKKNNKWLRLASIVPLCIFLWHVAILLLWLIIGRY